MKYPKASKRKVIAIVGPTASGKSDFAVSLAKELGAEIISADSRQIYKGMDIGTGKITRKEMRAVPHHLLSIVSPKTVFNVVKFQKQTNTVLKKISKKNRLPLIVGGTGFWIDALINGTRFPEAPANAKLRNTLSKLTAEKLFSMLKKADPKRAKNIDRHNKVRLIRALEIARYGKKRLSPALETYDALYIGLDLPTEELYERISKRLTQRIKKGMISEVANLHKRGISWNKLEKFGLEYRRVAIFLQGKISKEEMLEQLDFAIKHYAKRQRTWFKRNDRIVWLNPTKKQSRKKALLLVKRFLKT